MRIAVVCVVALMPAALSPAVLGAADGGDASATAGAAADPGGHWNAADSKELAGKLVKDALGASWATDFAAKHGRNPSVAVGPITVVADGKEGIDGAGLAADIGKAFLVSGKVNLITAKDPQADLSLVADYVVGVSIAVQNTIDRGVRTKTFAVDCTLTESRSQRLVWEGGAKLGKMITQGAP